MITKLKTLLFAAVAAVALGAPVVATATPKHALVGFPRHYRYHYAPGVGYAPRAVIGDAIAARSYPYYEGYSADPYGYGAGGAYLYPCPGYGYYYGY